MDNKAMYRLTYGLFVLSAQGKDARDNGCIINTAAQVTTEPNRVTIAVNKTNYTHDLIRETGLFNISVLTEEAPFSLFQNFGMRSGRDASVDKFDGMGASRSENGLLYLPRYTNAVISGRVVTSIVIGTHTLFLADVTDAQVLSGAPSVTYGYYQQHIKPAPVTAPTVKGWRCTVCGYVYEGETLPPDFICPLCNHDASYFEKIV
jgi:flavin reductase (DIM6/NTAB) family NADH-FMN oxidoreductase RutF/rubredoxin